MRNKCNYWSCHNFVDKNEGENEDNIEFVEGENVDQIALADGAGGVGIFCKDWSQKLVKSIPESYKAINKNWFIDKSKEFFESIHDKLPNTDLFVKEKFLNQGSYSTLLYAWIEKRERKLYCLGVGDTYLFIFRKKEKSYCLETIFPKNTQSNINSNPTLLNWRLEVSDVSFLHEEYSLEEADVIVACTDSIARWLFLHLYLFDTTMSFFTENPSSEELQRFKFDSKYSSMDKLLEAITSLDSEENYIEFLNYELNKGLLEPDDFTLFTYTVS